MGPSGYTFEAFRRDIEERVRALNARFRDPDADWPGVLFLDVREGLAAETFSLAGMTPEEKNVLASRTLPELIVRRGARRVCWLMPAWRQHDGDREECLVLIFAERGRSQIVVAAVFRSDHLPPRLGYWERSGVGEDVASGLFVEALVMAVSAVPPWIDRRARLGRG